MDMREVDRREAAFTWPPQSLYFRLSVVFRLPVFIHGNSLLLFPLPLSLLLVLILVFRFSVRLLQNVIKCRESPIYFNVGDVDIKYRWLDSLSYSYCLVTFSIIFRHLVQCLSLFTLAYVLLFIPLLSSLPISPLRSYPANSVAVYHFIAPVPSSRLSPPHYTNHSYCPSHIFLPTSQLWPTLSLPPWVLPTPTPFSSSPSPVLTPILPHSISISLLSLITLPFPFCLPSLLTHDFTHSYSHSSFTPHSL